MVLEGATDVQWSVDQTILPFFFASLSLTFPRCLAKGAACPILLSFVTLSCSMILCARVSCLLWDWTLVFLCWWLLLLGRAMLDAVTRMWPMALSSQRLLLCIQPISSSMAEPASLPHNTLYFSFIFWHDLITSNTLSSRCWASASTPDCSIDRLRNTQFF